MTLTFCARPDAKKQQNKKTTQCLCVVVQSSLHSSSTGSTRPDPEMRLFQLQAWPKMGHILFLKCFLEQDRESSKASKQLLQQQYCDLKYLIQLSKNTVLKKKNIMYLRSCFIFVLKINVPVHHTASIPYSRSGFQTNF